MADRRHENRPPRQPAVKLCFGDVLVLQRQAVKLKRWSAGVFVVGDHRLAAAGIAGHGVDRDRIIGRKKAGIDQRAQQPDAAGRVTTGIGDVLRPRDAIGLPRQHFRESVDPVGIDAVRGAGVQHFRRGVAQACGHGSGFFGRVVGQAEDHEVDLGHQVTPSGWVAASFGRKAAQGDV